MGKRGGRIKPPAMRATKKRAPAAAAATNEDLDSDMYDEVDQFHSRRDKISLRVGAGDSDDDEEEEEVEGVMDIPVSGDMGNSHREESMQIVASKSPSRTGGTQVVAIRVIACSRIASGKFS